jgi:hypothetical protein
MFDMKFSRAIFNAAAVAACMLLCISSAFSDDNCDFYEDWEGGIGDWYPNNGIWEVGTPGEGYPVCHSGTQCAATVLSGNYPNTNSCFISPTFRLPAVSENEEIYLRFWHWFSIASYDQCDVKISIYNENDGMWSNYTTIGGSAIAGESSVWSIKNVELTEYAEKKVRLAFCLSNGSFSYTSTGWYLDDIQIICGQGVWVMTTDTDNDGVPDCRDQCPNTPANSYVNNVGCKATTCYSQTQVNKMVSDILMWGDTDGDGKIGLNEAIKALQTTSGVSGQ